jgi:hypothetical protein
MEFIGVIIFVFLVVLPVVAIFSFTATVTEGIYNWASSQKYNNSRKKSSYSTNYRTTEDQYESVQEYLGYTERFEDSEEFKEILDSNNFDVRNFLKKQ